MEHNLWYQNFPDPTNIRGKESDIGGYPVLCASAIFRKLKIVDCHWAPQN